MRLQHIPSATYRLQLTADFSFNDATRIVPYLQALGISDLYLSPILAARADSLHGYDGIDPQRINPALGGDEGFRRLSAAVSAAGMHILLDIVPNHLAVSPENEWWVNVLRHGRRSPYAVVFDIDWAPSASLRRERVLLPILGEHFGVALEAGQLRLELTVHGLMLRYFDWSLPIRPESYATVLGPDVPLPSAFERLEDVPEGEAWPSPLRETTEDRVRSRTVRLNLIVLRGGLPCLGDRPARGFGRGPTPSGGPAGAR